MEPRTFMARALALAAQGRATTHPNPRVGCVIVRDGRIIGEGWHQRAGEPHAEVFALRAADELARGADVYVTLEPCAHHGRTPPCADALIAAGVARVFAAAGDPFDKVAGKGFAKLRAAGIECTSGLMETEARALCRGFLSRIERGRPWVSLKLAMSLDGRTAMANGESRWITGEQARADVHRLRAEAGAVLSSSETVLADDPELNVRLPTDYFWPRHAFPGEAGHADRPPATPSLASPAGGNSAIQGTVPYLRQPDRIVLDSSARVPTTAKVWREGARRFWLTAEAGMNAAENVETVVMPRDANGQVDLAAALAFLATRDINEVLVECGPRLAGSLLRANLVDELIVYAAPKLLGDAARGLVRLPGLERLADHVALAFTSAELLGPDLKITARLTSKGS
ncbi:bifunctional diaminohydroxyphosphoribosylaminopyrimidine deaminase/5-amino-6-(5-phosphoribosylamino)uracil reductase RibD [Nevskia ramosa]|uniref:bifunctional diaminohydroxyphosphoribosylaminopyrimidine deaminase/5-amino-6-(5-phosphoribosylamino)uracil reductase RibD n=1 Tax=Nevskia ramosa TaxID=64002 RepID=UPI003F4F78CC